MRYRPGQHLRLQTDIRAVREKGRRLEGRAFTLWWRPRVSEAAPVEEPLQVRACVIASTAAIGCAVRRNRAKRRLRELFRLHQDRLPPGCDLLLIARAPVITWEMDPLKSAFSDACSRIRREFPSHG